MRIRPYRDGDLEHLTRRSHDDFGPESWENTKQSCNEHPTYTFEDEGVPVAVIGLVLMWTGTAHAWTVVSDQVRGNGLTLTKLVKEMLDSHCMAMGVWRVQAYVKEDAPENRRWIKALGFKRESIMFRGSPEGKNLLLYVRHYNGRT